MRRIENEVSQRCFGPFINGKHMNPQFVQVEMNETTPFNRRNPYHVGNDAAEPSVQRISPYHINKLPRKKESAMSPLKTAKQRSQSKYSLIDDAMGDLASEFEFCMVFPAVNSNFTERGKGIVMFLMKLGLELFIYRARDDDEVFVLGRMPLEVVREFAETYEYYLMLDPLQAQTQLERGDQERSIAPVSIEHRPDICHLKPYEYIYVPYHSRREELYAKQADPNVFHSLCGARDHPFRELHRLKLTAMLLQSSTDNTTLALRRLIQEKHIIDCFPLHNQSTVALLHAQWSTFPIQKLPILGIKEYFGEKIGLYFAFAEHLSGSLFMPVVLGIPLQIAVIMWGREVEPYLAAYSFYIALWAVFMLERWKRQEKRIALQWGSIGFEECEIDRSDFQGEHIKSYIDGSKMVHFPTRKRVFYFTQSFLGVCVLLMLALGVVISIYIIRFTVEDRVGIVRAQIMASLLNSLQIQVLNYLYGFILKHLTDRENHRTDTHYEDSMIVKIFSFLFVNSYASFYYLAFVAELVGDCPVQGCMYTLGINVCIVFGSTLAGSLFTQLVLPYVSYKYRYYCVYRNHRKHNKRNKISTNNTSYQNTPTTDNSPTDFGTMNYNMNNDGSVDNNMDNMASNTTSPDSEFDGEGNIDRSLSRPEKEHLLTTYDQLTCTISDFSELAVGFGYTALFVSALPIAASFFLVFGIIQIKGDGWKLLHVYKRPFPRGCEDIGTWQNIFMIITVAAVVTNAGLAVFTMQGLDYLDTTTRYWCFIGFQWVCFALQAFIMVAIPDVPEEINIQLQRTAFIQRKLIDRIPDETYSGDKQVKMPNIVFSTYPVE